MNDHDEYLTESEEPLGLAQGGIDVDDYLRHWHEWCGATCHSTADRQGEAAFRAGFRAALASEPQGKPR